MASNPTSVTQYQTGFAPEIAPYAQNLLGTAAGTVYQYKKDAAGNVITDQNKFLDDGTTPNANYGMPTITGFQPFQEYSTADRFAQFSPLQQQAFSGAQNMQPSQTTAGASQLAGMAGLGALGTNYQPINFQSQSILGGGQQGGQGGIGVGYDSGSQTPNTSGGGGASVSGVPQNTLGAYMSPYMQNVVQRQQQDAQRQADIAMQAQNAQAARSGAFGGSGNYLMRSQAAGNLARQKGDIQAQGLQNAYQQALGQFNTEQQARQQAAQLGEQSRQYGAGLGLQGLQTALSGANTLGQLGQQQFQQGMDINKLQATYGGEQQKQMQQMLDADYQNFINRQNYPYKQLGFMSDMIRGLPLSQTGSSVYQQPPSALGQLAGLSLGAASLFGKKEGGSVSSYAKGGLSITHPDEAKLENMMDDLSDAQLQQIIQRPTNPTQYRLAQEELASRQSMPRMGIGGIVAFAKGGDEGEKKEDSSGVSGLAYLAAAFPGLFQAGKAIAAPIASGSGSVLKGLANLGKAAGPAYVSPAASATLGGGLALSEASTNYLNKLSDEDLAALAESGGGSDAALAAAIMGQGRENTKNKDQYAAEVGGGRGKAPASAYDVQALAEHLGNATRGPTAKENKGGKGTAATSQQIVQGATRIAEQQGVPKETFEDMMDRMMTKFKGANDKDLEGLAKMIAEEKENAKSVMGDATRNALAKFGFQMAANASQPGAGKGFAGALRSAAAAGPALAESMQESRKLAQAAQDNARKMQIEFTKYKVALDKGDQQTAISLASNIRMMQQQQAQLEETIRHNKASEGLMGQRIAAAGAARGQEKTFAPILRGIGAANQMASKNAMELIKARPDLIQKGEKPEDALERVRSALAAKYRKEAVPMFGPTGKVYGGGNDDDMEE